MNHKIYSTLLFIAAMILTATTGSAITIGAGPVLQNSLGDTTDKRGTTWYQEFQDWSYSDLRALDVNGDQYDHFDFHDTARDLVAFYTHDDGTNLYFRTDLFDFYNGSEVNNLDIYVTIDCASGGQIWFPDYMDTKGDPAHMWEYCIALYNSSAAAIYDQWWNTSSNATHWLGSYYNSDLDAIEFGIKRQALLNAGWDGSSVIHFQVFSVRDDTNGGNGEITPGSDITDAFGVLVRDVGDSTGTLTGAIASTASAGRAKYAIIAHANQSVAPKQGTQKHIYTDRSDIDLHPGFVRLLDSGEMLNTPINLHISGTLFMSFLWANQDPTETGYPDRDGPTFLTRVDDFVTTGPGSLVGGVLAEHIMPYFEGEVNQKSIEQNSELLEHLFGLSETDMKVMHVPERVIRSNTNNTHTASSEPLDGKTFEEIESSGFVATYLDEVTHAHWWFYPNEQNNAGWDTLNCGRWAGGQGNDEETYHHKIHKINGVYSFLINDREDQSKFGNFDSGMQHDTRYTLLDKALNPDYAQITVVFDDWEAFAGNSFASPDPNNNADQFHTTLRWAANKPWIEIVNLKDVVNWSSPDPNWIIDHGYVYDKPSQTYEWLKRASEHTYDNWYYGGALEEDFFNRVPVVHWDGGPFIPSGMKKYGDMNTPGTLIRDSWDTIQSITSTNLKKLSEWSYSAMIYETAWHDEDANPDQYKSRNYQDLTQGGFTRGVAQGNCDESFEDLSSDNTSGWAIRLHGHVRDMGVMKDAGSWINDIKNGTQTEDTWVYAVDIDDDTLNEYVLRNNKVFLCFERWGARLIKAFVYDETLNGGDARSVIGVPISNPPEEHENEGADNNRCSGFKDRYSTGHNDNRYIDMDFAFTAPTAGSDSWTFTSKDGLVTKQFMLPKGRDIVLCNYQVNAAAGTIYSRFGIGPNQMDLMKNGPQNLIAESDSTYKGLRNSEGAAAYVVAGNNCSFVGGSIANAGWEARELPLVEQYEIYNTATNYSVALAFSATSAQDADGDGLSNESEINTHTTDHFNPDSDSDDLPDGWEVSHSLNPDDDGSSNPNNGGNGNPDTDVHSNIDEYIANTDPQSPTSYVHIATIDAINSTTRDIHFPAQRDRMYRLWYNDSTSLDSGAWSIMDTWTNGATAQTKIVTDNEDMGSPSNDFRIYRLEVQLP